MPFKISVGFTLAEKRLVPFLERRGYKLVRDSSSTDECRTLRPLGEPQTEPCLRYSHPASADQRTMWGGRGYDIEACLDILFSATDSDVPVHATTLAREISANFGVPYLDVLGKVRFSR
jgi:hypothetical protein